MRAEHIRALTGVRFFAALWVVLYHSTRHNFDLLVRHHYDALHAVYPLTAAGVRGVDVFFILSGFVLALNYADRLGGRFRLGPTGRFLWLRLARIWPLYMLVILASGALRLLRHELWGSAPVDQLTWPMLLKQALLVQQWFPPRTGQTSWDGPAWSLSAEWLAYLLFPVAVLALTRLRRGLGAPWLLALSGLVMLPLVVGITLRHDMGGPVWVARILCEFVAGMLLHAGASRLDLGPRGRRWVGRGAVASVLAVVVVLYAVRGLQLDGWVSMYVVVLFVPLVGCLALGTGPLHDLLSTRTLVLGGAISYALYLIHSPLLYLFRDVTHFTGALYLAPLPRYHAELLFIPVMVLLAWVLHRGVEEPARRLMRRAIEPASARPVPSEPPARVG